VTLCYRKYPVCPHYWTLFNPYSRSCCP
jgi:hypothetical protein